MTIAQALVVTSLWLSLVYLLVVAGTAIVAALRAGGRREERVLRDEAVSGSRFTIPVSIIVPLTGDPAFEVIVVGDAAAAAQIDELSRDWQLEAREFFYRQALRTADVERIYRSAVDPRLMVIDKASGGYGDTLNCGVNVARYRYVMSVPPGIAFDNDALLRIMAAALGIPAADLAPIADEHARHLALPPLRSRPQRRRRRVAARCRDQSGRLFADRVRRRSRHDVQTASGARGAGRPVRAQRRRVRLRPVADRR